jgi:abortive infection bacteriophage resistance protein
MRYLKPALSFEDQADLLIARGMVGDRALMINRLAVVNYYRLSGYCYPFRDRSDPKGEAFKTGTTFDEVWGRYVFDRRLRLMVMDAVERFEVSVRALLAYHHSHAHGPFAYFEDVASLPKLNAERRKDFIRDVRAEMQRSSREPFVRHFRATYSSHHQQLPLWMATEVMSFGTVLTLFRGASNAVKTKVSTAYGMPPEVFDTWLLAVAAVRNICAHHSRLWNRILGVKPWIPKKDSYPDWHEPVEIKNDRVFSILTICQYCLTQVAPQSNWKDRVKDLIVKSPAIPLADMGFPSDWQKSPLWT